LEVATLSKEKLETELTDITNELRERVKLLQFKAAEKEQRIIFDAPANHISANVNKEKLLRVVGNLVNNAIKFSPIAGDISVRLKAGANDFTIEVEDCGIGIPDNLKDKVFDLFSEAKRYGTLGEQPFGLGLSISKQIVEAHGGKIWFNSTEGKGTTFYILIPV
jgi:signal transduction histidine kinase